MELINKKLSDEQIKQLDNGEYITVCNTHFLLILIRQGVCIDTDKPLEAIYWLDAFHAGDCIEVIQFRCNDLRELDVHKLLKEHAEKIYARLRTLIDTDIYALYSELRAS